MADPLPSPAPRISAPRRDVTGRPLRREPHVGGIFGEYAEVAVVIAAVTVAAWFVPFDYRVFGDIYLLAVIVLCLRVGPGPIFFATVLSVVAWNFVIVPPRMSFSRLDVKDGMFLGTYFVVALIAGQLTARLRTQQRKEQVREQRATALYHLTRALSAARTLDEAVAAALEQAESLFGVPTALLMPDAEGRLVVHPASHFALGARDTVIANAAFHDAAKTGKSVGGRGEAVGLHLPVVRANVALGVFSLAWPHTSAGIPRDLFGLMEGFAAQIGLLIEREQLRASGEREQLLAESERLYRTLLDSVSHELKTPVAVLSSAAENIVRARGPRRESLAIEIQTAARRLNHLVSNLLNQTRLDAGRLKARPDWCDVRDLFAAARRAVGTVLDPRSLNVEVPADMPLFKADAVLMEHVLANLLLNAVHHTPSGTPVTLGAGADAASRRVFIVVADRGPGIAPDQRSRLFQKFERGDDARPGGLGLGLSIVRGFMAAQGGEVTVDENPGGGARFVLYLPHEHHASVPHE